VARTKEFDPDTALRAAMDLFWHKGYEATSLHDLVDHLGIGRASIYATFGNKHELYLAALRRYGEDVGGQTIGVLARPGPALDAVRALVRSFADEALADQDRKGCLVTNTAVECLPEDREFGRLVEASFDALETAIAVTLTRASREGELAADRDPRALARFLLTLLQGIRVLAKVPDERRVRDAVDQALSLLD